MHGHLERVSWKILEEYPSVVRDLIRNESGIYALYRRDRLYYVGLASGLMGRIKQHLRDGHSEKWDRFSVYVTGHADHMKELESLLLRIVKPTGNKQSGRFVGSTNLKQTLNARVKAEDDNRRAHLIGGSAAKRRRKAQARRSHGGRLLSGLVDRSIRLKGRRSGWEYAATLRSDGTIRYDGETYESPHQAGRAAVKARCNGWLFWRYRERGEWVPLKNLRP